MPSAAQVPQAMPRRACALLTTLATDDMAYRLATVASSVAADSREI